jgi:hypothetical protein
MDNKQHAQRKHDQVLRAAFFFFDFHFLNGLGGRALLGTVKIVFIASRNLSNASGPSIISGWDFMPQLYAASQQLGS